MGDRKQQILDTTSEILQTKVFSAFSYQDIADRLGITKAAIHSHYRTKETLGNALLDQYSELTISLHSEAENAGETAWEKFDAYVAALVRIVIDENQVCQVTLLQIEHNVIPESMQKKVSLIYNNETAWLAKILKQGVDEGAMFFPGSPDDQASLIFAAFQGGMMNARAEGKEIFEKIMRQVTKSMTAG